MESQGFKYWHRHYQQLTPVSADSCHEQLFIPIFSRFRCSGTEDNLEKFMVATPNSRYIPFDIPATAIQNHESKGLRGVKIIEHMSIESNCDNMKGMYLARSNLFTLLLNENLHHCYPTEHHFLDFL